MSSDIVIRAEGLGKRYRLGELAPYFTLRETIQGWARVPLKYLGGRGKVKKAGTSGHVWALRDVSFDVREGEVLGIIGRNGAGKSTLLKILSRITKPSTGRAEICGRVGSLLEVGTGFHPELTGRENIFLNGAILGMRRDEIKRRWDEIVDFSGVERFLDTPVKRFSSGMRVRLAFAVAAHLEPEILLIDEVLAVGDAEFQKKCLRKMDQVAKGGRTILFVSHNMAAVQSLCDRCLLIEAGSLALVESSAQAISRYLSKDDVYQPKKISLNSKRRGTGSVRFVGLQVSGAAGATESAPIVSGGPAQILLDLKVQNPQRTQRAHLAIVISDAYGNRVTCCDTTFVGAQISLTKSEMTIACNIDELCLTPGRYYVYIWIAVNNEEADRIESAGYFDVCQSDFFGTGVSPVPNKHGPMMVKHDFAVLNHGDVLSGP